MRTLEIGLGEYISYNTLPIMEQWMMAGNLLNLARWIKEKEKPYYINLELYRSFLYNSKCKRA